MSSFRVAIQWSQTARKGLEKLPHKVRRGLLDKTDELLKATDPRKPHKPLVGPLNGYYTMNYSRYRAIYRVEEQKLPDDVVLIILRIVFVAVGIRKEGDKKDIYRFAQKLLEMGAFEPQSNDEPPENAERAPVDQ